MKFLMYSGGFNTVADELNTKDFVFTTVTVIEWSQLVKISKKR